MVYTHVLNRGPLGVRSPVDRLWSSLRGWPRTLAANRVRRRQVDAAKALIVCRLTVAW